MKKKLLKCPFCGGRAQSALYTHDRFSNGVAVRCMSCGCSTKRLLYSHDGVKFSEVIRRMENRKAKAAELWNKRFN
jgi:Lar family restriction alleviation protein